MTTKSRQVGRIVVLEGPDGSGKSTLANSFVDRGFEYVHCGVPKPGENVFGTYTSIVWKAIRSKKDTVIDRLHLGERVYGTVMRGEDTLGFMGSQLIERLLRSVRARVIIALPPVDVCVNNWYEKRKERWDPSRRTGDYVDAENKIRDIWSMYREIARDMAFYLTYDYTDRSSIDVANDYCLNWCGNVGENTPENPYRVLPYGVIGAPTARYLFVGEQINVNKTRVDLPFYALDACSKYLFNAIREAGIGEANMAFCNAVTPRGIVTDEHRHRRKSTSHRNLSDVALHLPNFRRAIALGNTAARVCKDHGLNFVRLDHPSYWKRFHHHALSDYAHQIKGATAPCTF